MSPRCKISTRLLIRSPKQGWVQERLAQLCSPKNSGADLTLMDEWKGRRLAVENGLAVVGCIGILEELYRRKEIENLLNIYQELLRQNIRVDVRTLQDSLNQFGLDSL